MTGRMSRDGLLIPGCLFLIKPIRGNFKSPDFTIEWFGVPSGYPDFVLIDDRRMLVAFFPDDVGLELRPGLSVFRIPHVVEVRVFFGLLPASQNPHPATVDD